MSIWSWALARGSVWIGEWWRTAQQSLRGYKTKAVASDAARSPGTKWPSIFHRGCETLVPTGASYPRTGPVMACIACRIAVAACIGWGAYAFEEPPGLRHRCLQRMKGEMETLPGFVWTLSVVRSARPGGSPGFRHTDGDGAGVIRHGDHVFPRAVGWTRCAAAALRYAPDRSRGRRRESEPRATEHVPALPLGIDLPFCGRGSASH